MWHVIRCRSVYLYLTGQLGTPGSHLRFTGHPGSLTDLQAWPTGPIYGMLWQDVRPARPCLMRCVRLRIGRRAIAPL